MENRKSKFAAFLSSIIAGIIVAMIVYFGLNFMGFAEYKASAKLLTTSVEDSNEENPAESFAATLNSNAIKERTLENLKIDWPASKLDNKLKLTPIKSSKIVDISVVDNNKQRAEDLADEYADLSATVINNIYNTGANVTEYSYQNAKTIDNTLKYAAYAGLAGFLIYLVISLVSVTRHNRKLEKSLGQNDKKEKAKTKKQVKKNKKAIEEKEEKQKEIKSATEKQEKADIEAELDKNYPKEDLKQETRPLSPANDEDYDEFATRKIDSYEIASAIDRVDEESKSEENLVENEVYDEDKISEEMSEQRANEDPEEVENSNRLEILGKLPKYQRGALDV